ncbi:MAG TPA: TolC family protein [Bryobacteraceae bacterium]|nr:TolC family protein [Bryobacteraceae bacterium]
MRRVGFGCLTVWAGVAMAQGPPLSITLQDAVARAKQHAGQLQAAGIAVQQAREDRLQARTLRLPTLNAFNQTIYTEGNGTPSGTFVSNDGVHVYNEQAQVHEEVLSIFRKGEVRRALATEAAARARVDIAARGLNATVIQNYYGIVGAQRRFSNAQLSLRDAEQFVDVTEKQEKGGEAAHSDVIKARLTLQQRQRDLQDAQVAIEKAKIALGVLIFPNFNAEFTVADDAGAAELLPPVEEVRAKAEATSPDVKAARSSLDAAGYDVGVARYGYLPSLSVDLFYGINANQFAIHGGRDPEEANRRNLGYAAQVTLNVPVWNWGMTQSKIRQAELRRSQAQLELTLAGRALQGNLATAMAEARAALQQLDSLRSSVDLATESLRLTLLRYQAGEAVTLEVVDAQTTLAQSRNSYGDGLVRYRMAVANLQTLTGSL